MEEPLWVKKRVPSKFWNSRENRYHYMTWLGEKVGFQKPEDWYRITHKDFTIHKGNGLLAIYYQDSPSKAVMEYIPDYNWKEWLFHRAPNGFWKDSYNRRRYMDWLGEKLGFKTSEDWYKITQKDFIGNKGRTLLKYYQGSPITAVKEYIPDYNWKEWFFDNVSRNFWEDPKNRRRYMEWLAQIRKFKNPEDWYEVTLEDFHNNNGATLVSNYFGDSPSATVKEYIPDYDWKEWLFGNVPLNFWNNPNNRHRYMEWLGEQLGYKIPEDWYKITAKQVKTNKGRTFLRYYQDSHSAAVMEYFPDYDWKEWLFFNAPLHFWDKPENHHRYMDWLGEKLSYKEPEDWYGITHRDFIENKGSSFLRPYQGSPSAAVMAYIPDYNWQPENFSYRAKKQKRLYRIVKGIFSEYDVKWNFKHHEMRFKDSSRSMELDIYVISLNLGIEYQGEQHVLPAWGGIPALKKLQQRDQEKRQACKTYGITLIEVPHSWDGQEDTAIEMLSHQFVKKVKDRVRGTKQIQSALKAINTYCKTKQRKQSKKNSGNHQTDFSFIVQ